MLLATAMLACLDAGATPEASGLVRRPAVPPLPVVAEAPLPAAPVPPYVPSRWSLSFEISNLFTTTENPFIFLVGKTRYEGLNHLDYRLVTHIAEARYELTRPRGPWILRGNFEASAGLLYSHIHNGPEDYIAGGLIGMRYNFVPKDSRFSPYLDIRLGINATDASRVFHGQQQDFTFTYVAGAGLRYAITPRWKAWVGIVDQHESNFFMTEPNFGFNVAGVSLGIQRHF